MNKAEFAAIYEANFRRVFNYISYRVGHYSDVEDLVSTVFVHAVEKHETFDSGRGTAEMWIISIARNVVTDYYRDMAKRQHDDIDAFAAVLPSGDILPDQQIVQMEEQRYLIRALAVLDDRERQMVALRYGADLTNRQIARQLNVSASNVGVILFRSLRKLRKELSKEVRP